MTVHTSEELTGGNGTAPMEQTMQTTAVRANGSRSIENTHGHDEVDLIICWTILQKRRTFVIQCWIGAMLLALLVSLFLPKYYESTAAILPQTDTKEGTSLGTLLAATGAAFPGAAATAQTLGITLPGMPITPTDVFVGILKSREMTDAVIRQFHL